MTDTPITVDPLVVARFWSKVQVGRPTVCWPWQERSRNEHGYVVMHVCDNPPCCNPAHLILGTQLDNVTDMHNKLRRRYDTALGHVEVVDIKRRVAAGETQASIARRYGVSQAYISMINSGDRRASTRKDK